MRLFECSKSWPKEKRYALTDQIRRSSRSVNVNIAEAWRKRRYERHFISKLSDADAEAAETRVWLRFASDCGYLPSSEAARLNETYNQMCGGLVNMMRNPPRWCGPGTTREPSIPYDTC